MKRLIVLLFCSLFLSGCASIITKADIMSMKVGITKADFIKTYGEPEQIAYKDGRWVLRYAAVRNFYIFVFDNEEKLISWMPYEKTDSTSTSFGIIMTMP